MSESETPTPRARRNPFTRWWQTYVVANVDHQEVVGRVQEEAGWSAHFLFMLLMSAGIAVLGLLLSSPAVVIGAMLISPLMGPIIGLGFAIATFDSGELRRSATALALGVLVAVLFCAIVVAVSPLQTVTSEIAARTRPNLFDLLVALFSGLAGTYAMIRGRHGAIVGVAIATALMPPLAVIGFGVATLNGTVFGGATLLFFTNLMTIAAAAAILARIYGFAANLSPQQTGLQATLIVAVLLALAIPLGFTLRQIAWEALASRQVREVITNRFGEEARISEIAVDYDVDPIEVEATVLTPQFQRTAERESQSMLRAMLGRPVAVAIDQFRVGTEGGEAEAAQIAAARGAAERSSQRIAERLSLVAGVAVDEVLIDSGHSRAVVRAVPLPGATLASYRALEARVAAAEPRWSISLIPPPLPLPAIEFDGDEPTEGGMRALRTAIWAGQRLAVPIGVATANDEQAQIVIAAFSGTGATARRIPGDGPAVELRWLPPGDQPR